MFLSNETTVEKRPTGALVITLNEILHQLNLIEKTANTISDLVFISRPKEPSPLVEAKSPSSLVTLNTKMHEVWDRLSKVNCCLEEVRSGIEDQLGGSDIRLV